MPEDDPFSIYEKFVSSIIYHIFKLMDDSIYNSLSLMIKALRVLMGVIA